MKTIKTLTALSLISLAAPQVASALDLSGSRLGEADYKFRLLEPSRPALRIYLNRIEGQQDSYYVILLEYPRLAGIAPQYLATHTVPVVNKAIGYLNKIVQKIAVYKATPGKTPGTYEMRSLAVRGSKIELKAQPAQLILTLANDANAKDPLGGARIISTATGKPVAFFPERGDFTTGSEYRLANLTYKNARLDSTWRKSFLKGPYLAAYGKLDDVALRLDSPAGRNRATFIIDEKFSNVPKAVRERVFTNPESAYLEGAYNVSEPVDGMFVFSAAEGKHPNAESVTGRIGLFIDVFDATKSLNQDVVELALINPENPQDFLMYYEHPENGEGDGARN